MAEWGRGAKAGLVSGLIYGIISGVNLGSEVRIYTFKTQIARAL